MNLNDPNIQLLETVAGQLGEELCEELVFVGGAVAGLLITDPAMPSIRPTEDVDTVCRVQALTEYHRIEDKLRARFGGSLKLPMLSPHGRHPNRQRPQIAFLGRVAHGVADQPFAFGRCALAQPAFA